MVCPGPVFSRVSERAFTGHQGEVFGKGHAETSKRMATSRCAHLMAVSIANKLDEAWIAIQPVLALHYLSQYLPSVARSIIPRWHTPERAAKLREGEDII